MNNPGRIHNCPDCKCETPVARKTYDARVRHIKQASSLDAGATRRHTYWTAEDFATLARTDITMRQKAIVMGRTYYALKTMLERIRTQAKVARETHQGYGRDGTNSRDNELSAPNADGI